MEVGKGVRTQRSYLTHIVNATLVLSLLGCSHAKSSDASPQVGPNGTSPLPILNAPASKAFHQQELLEVTSVTVTADGLESVDTSGFSTDPAAIRALVDLLANATVFGENGGSVNRTATGSYTLVLGLRNSADLRMTWWADGQTPNLYDVGQREWWVVSGLEPIVRSYLPRMQPGTVASQSPTPPIAVSPVPPEIKTADLTDQERVKIARQLFAGYLESCKVEDTPSGRLLDYRIDRISIYPAATDGRPLVLANYSVLPATKKNRWLAGNGKDGEDGWVIQKQVFLDLALKDGAWYIRQMSTSP